MYCKNCGAEMPDNSKFCNNCGKSVESTKKPKLPTLKLVIGILSILYSTVFSFMGCSLTMAVSEEPDYVVYVFEQFAVAVLLLVGGIVSVADRKSTRIGGDIACIIIYALATILTIHLWEGQFIIGIVSFVFCVVHIISLVLSCMDKNII